MIVAARRYALAVLADRSSSQIANTLRCNNFGRSPVARVRKGFLRLLRCSDRSAQRRITRTAGAVGTASGPSPRQGRLRRPCSVFVAGVPHYAIQEARHRYLSTWISTTCVGALRPHAFCVHCPPIIGRRLLGVARRSSSTPSPTEIHSGFMALSVKPMRPAVVLVAIDHEWAARSLDSVLSPNGFAVLRAHTGQQALDLARSTRPDAIILDFGLPGIGAVQICERLRSDDMLGPLTPIIVTASEAGPRNQRMSVYAAGAWLYCPQPLDGEAFIAQLRNFIDGKRAGDELREASLLDDLTGLYSIRGLARRAREIGAEAVRLHAPLACIAFSPGTDGTSDGNSRSVETRQVIGHLGTLFRSCGRASDAIGRVGQSEFGVIAPATDGAGARRLVRRIQRAVADMGPTDDGPPLRVKLRAGYAAAQNFADSPVDAVEMLLRATTALRHTNTGNSGSVQSYEDLPVNLA